MSSSFVINKKLRLRETNKLVQSSKIEEQLELEFEPRWSDSGYMPLSVGNKKEKEGRVNVSTRNVP